MPIPTIIKASCLIENPRNEIIGIVIPSFKESANIRNLLLEIRKFIPDSKIAIVDDSPDNETVSVVQALRFNNLTLIHRAYKGGRGSAVLEGMHALIKENCSRIIEMDADFSHPPKQLTELISLSCNQNLDLLIASRYLPSSQILNWPFSRRIFSLSSNHLARWLLQVPISDYTNGYRIYSKCAVLKILETCGRLGSGFISLSEILVNLFYRDFKVGETPTIFTNRLRGESSVTFKEIKNALFGLVKIYFLKKQLISIK
jgi:dolichol-phosphate mannosyltransferase